MDQLLAEYTNKKLGFGLMRLPMKGDEVDVELVKQMVDLFMGKGFSYFDTSPVYVMGKSETAARKALVERYPRDSFQLATKLPIWAIQSKDDIEKYFQLSLSSLGVEYVDFYLLHGMCATVSDRFPTSNLSRALQFGAWEFLKQKKAEGKIKHIGFSFHDSADVLDDMLNRFPEAEFVQLQINYADWEDATVQSHACYEVARRHGKPIVVMEPVKGGTLCNLRAEAASVLRAADPQASAASWAIRYAASLDGVMIVLSGMSTMEQMTDNASYMADFSPLSEAERTVIANVVQTLKQTDTIGCTACRYCTDGCPRHINIPGIFAIENEYRVYQDMSLAKRRYGNLVQAGGKAMDCIACGACESHCPQKLPIIRYLKEASARFDTENA